jgi:hypothetical protein
MRDTRYYKPEHVSILLWRCVCIRRRRTSFLYQNHITDLTIDHYSHLLTKPNQSILLLDNEDEVHTPHHPPGLHNSHPLLPHPSCSLKPSNVPRPDYR